MGNLEGGARLTLEVSSLAPFSHVSLTVVSVVELTVGVMCSCFTTFPGFFRHHLPFLSSLLSFLRSSFRSLHLHRHTERSSDRINTSGVKSSTKMIITKEIRVILGPSVDARGRFINPVRLVPTDPDWLSLVELTSDSHAHADNAPEPTHRDRFEEMIEEQRSHMQYPPSSLGRHPHRSGIESASHAATEPRLPNVGRAPKEKQSSTSGSAWWKIHRQSETSHTGYWDILSFIRTDTTKSACQSEINPTSDSDAV